MNDDPNPRDSVEALMLSQTLQRLAALAHACPLDLRDPAQVKSALATTSRALIAALDAKRLHFEDPGDEAMLHGLLMTALEVVMDGRLKASTRVVRVN